MTAPLFLRVPHLAAASPIALQEMAQHIGIFASERIAGNDFAPVLTAIDRPRGPVMLMEYEGDAAQRASVTALAAVVMHQRHAPVEVLWLSDVYYRSFAEDEPRPATMQEAEDDWPRPAEDPAATEALALLYVNHRGLWECQLPYGWDDDGGLVWRKPDRPWQEIGKTDPEQQYHAPMYVAVSMATGLGPTPPPDLAAAVPQTDHELRVLGVVVAR